MNTETKEPKVALVHDYLNVYGGAEKTLEAIIELFPNAPIYTAIYDPSKMTPIINSQDIRTPKNTLLSKFPKHLTFLMPFVFENIDLREFDIVISDGTAWGKSVLTKPSQLHVSYIHTPPRFLYKYSVESSSSRNKWYYKHIIALIDMWLLLWDYSAAQRPDFLITNSKETQKRVNKFYRRDATVIYPPAEILPRAAQKPTALPFSEFYLSIGRLAAYKNVELVIKGFNEMGLNLVVAGSGAEEKKLKELAKGNIFFTGRVTEEEKEWLLQNCKGLINAVQDEDLGLVPIEGMARGKPILAHYSGGHKETVKEGLSGSFFNSLDTASFIEAFRAFDKKVANNEFDAQQITASIQDFDKEIFKTKLKTFVEEKFREIS